MLTYLSPDSHSCHHVSGQDEDLTTLFRGPLEEKAQAASSHIAITLHPRVNRDFHG